MADLCRPSLVSDSRLSGRDTTKLHSANVTATRRTKGTLTAILLVALIAGCGKEGPLPSIQVQPPADTAQAYFQAFNDLNLPLLQAHLIVDKRADPGFGGDWGFYYDTVPPKDFFGDVTCAAASQMATGAEVDCSFTAKETWEGFSAGPQRWRLHMSCLPPGPWLIDDWCRD